MIGKTLAHYKILSTLGVGGMGEVYRARDTKLDRDVAIKVLPAELAGNLERRTRFIREAKALARLKHPSIVTIYSVEEDNETLFLTMELVEGKNLDNVIPEEGLSLQKLLSIAIPLADAISYAHKQGITHRDLKPTNIMLDEEGRTKVLDFGLAKLMAPDTMADGATVVGDSVTAEGKVMGTTAYMSPEQAEGKSVDARSDIFSLGIVLYEMATGRRPFKGDTGISTITSILRDTPSQVHEVNHQLPRHLGRMVARCLAKEPDRRYQSGLDVRNELEGLKEETTSATGLEPSALPVTTIRPTANRKPIFLGIGSLLLLAAVLVIWQPWGRSGNDSGTVGTDAAPTDPRTVVPGVTPDDKRTMIVVLPFENMGPPEDAYFAAGVSQEITSTLASVGGLGLISRTSAGRYAGTQKTIREIGAELGVDYVVEGSVRWQKRADGPDRVRITPQLIRVSDDTQIWTEQYDREMEDIFEIQSSIAEEVAGQLGIALAATGMAGTSEPLTKNMEAYRLYLKAQKLWKTTEGDDAISLVLATLERAVELDPEFVAAWSILSRFHSGLYHGYTDRTEDRLVLAREAADRIFKISPDHPQGHIAFGYYYYWGRKDYERALEAFSKTGNLQESDPDVIEAVGFIRRRQGRWEEGLERIETAARLDPQSTPLAYEVAWTLEFLRRYDEALDWYDRAISLNPEWSWGYVEKARFHLLRTGDAVASESIVREAPDPVDPQWNFYLSYHRLHAGRYEDALELVAADTIRAYDSPSYMYPKPLWMALVSSCTDNNERTQELAEASLAYLQGRIRNESQDPRLRLALGQTYALLGRKAEALREGRMAIDIFPMSRDAIRGHAYQVRLSEIYALAGEEEAAVDLLEQLLAIPGLLSPNLIKTNPLYRSLHDNPRYEAVIVDAS